MSAGHDLDRSWSALSAALRAAGAPAASAPSDVGIVERIAAALAPLRLPAGVRRLWDLVEPGSIAVQASPPLASPGFALATWETHASELPGMVPRVLFPIAYESHCYLLVELDGADRDDGGAVFAWDMFGEEFRLAFSDVSQLLDYLARAVRDGRVGRDADGLYVVDGPGDRAWLIADPPGGLHPALGAITSIPAAITSWPEAWLVRSGMTPERRVPLGADHRIADVLARAGDVPVSARIQATVTGLAASGAGTRVIVGDGTATMSIWCPSSVTALGPVIDGTFEFHIVAMRPASPEPATLPPDAAAAVAERLRNLLGPADAIATEVRLTVSW